MRWRTNTKQLPVILKAALAYFALVFGAGFLLGPIRILFIVPRFGVLVAELMEYPLMLVVIVVAARWLVRKFQIAKQTLLVGLLALGLMMAFEFTLVLWLRGLTPAEYLSERDPLSSYIYYLMLVVFALMPLLVNSASSLRFAQRIRKGPN
jgi:hypothetical protein